MKDKTYQLNDDEKRRVIRQLTEILQDRKEILFAYVFGSFVEKLPFHDIDVGIYLSEIEAQESTFYSIDLAHHISMKIRIPVDVRVLNFAPVSFLYHVIRGDLILDKDEEARSRVVEQTVARYLDLKPIIRKGTEEAFGS